VALVTKVSDDRQSIVVQFCDVDESPLMKKLNRSDVQLAVLGSHKKEPPPGMREVPSKTRPGEASYEDPVGGIKHPSLSAAWRVYYERLIEKWQKSGHCMDLVFQ